MAKIALKEGTTFKLAALACGMFWTRDNISPEEATDQADHLRDMPVRGTEYLLAEGESYLVSVPFRWRN
jgi:hypothetical protein